MQPADPDSTEGEEHAAVLVFVPGPRHSGGVTDQRGMGERKQLEPDARKRHQMSSRRGRRVIVVEGGGGGVEEGKEF